MSQTAAIFNLLRDGKLHGTDEIQRVVYGRDHLGVARIGARIFDIKKKYGVEIETEAITKTIYGYRLVKNPKTMATVDTPHLQSVPTQSVPTRDGIQECCVPLQVREAFGYLKAVCPRCGKQFLRKVN